MKKLLFLLLCALLIAIAVTGCAQSAKVLISARLAESPLLGYLGEAFAQETGLKVEFEARDDAGIQSALADNQFEAALVLEGDAADKLAQGEWTGGKVFYDTLYLIGPEKDIACTQFMTQYPIGDILKQITLTSFAFAHPSPITPLGMRDIALWLAVDATPAEEQLLIATDDGQQLIHLASENEAYALISRDGWARYGGEVENLAVLLPTAQGITYQYVVLAAPVEEGKEPTPAQQFCQWMQGQTARTIVTQYKMPEAQVSAFESNVPAP